MIYIGETNYAAAASATTTASGYSASNVLTSTGGTWRSTGKTATLTITFPDRYIDLVAVHGVNTVQWAKITGKLSSGTVFTTEFGQLDIYGLRYKTIACTGGFIDELTIELATFDSTYVEAGYVFAGTAVSFDYQALQTFTESDDKVTLTQGRLANSTRGNLFNRANVTIDNDNDFEELRSKLDRIMLSGFGVPRPVMIECHARKRKFRTKYFLAILDGEQIGYDTNEIESVNVTLLKAIDGGVVKGIKTASGTKIALGTAVGSAKAQASIGFTEVFGGVEAS